MNGKRLIVIAAAVLAAAVSLTACSSASKGNPVKLRGAGASFPEPLYLQWFTSYNAAHPNIRVEYKSVGSSSGINRFMDKTVDFAASDAAMKPEDKAKVDGGVQLIPMTAGSIVLAYNLREIPNLRLSRSAYIGIFSGKVTKWNDPLITKANPNVKLPDQPISVIVRADGSGTTYVFTRHLSTISPMFEKTVGVNEKPRWPVGTSATGNDGVTESVMTTPGAIGYVQYGYAASQDVPMMTLENKSGSYVTPSIEAARVALASAEMPPDMIAWVPDPVGKEAYPIVAYTWMILHKKYDSKQKLDALRGLIDYALTDGQKESESLGYVPLPAEVAAKVKAAVDAL